MDWGSSADDESFWDPPHLVSFPPGGARGALPTPAAGPAVPGGPPPILARTNSPVAPSGPPPNPASPTAFGGPAAPGGPPTAPGDPVAPGCPPPAPIAPTAPGGPPPLPPLGPHLEVPIPLPVDRFTLPPIMSGEDYLQSRDLILFWLCTPGYSTAWDNLALVTNGRNLLASRY